MKINYRKILLFLAFFWLYSSVCHYPNVNEISRFGLTWSIVDRHRLDIDTVQSFTIDKAFYKGHYYCDKAPGLSFAAVPVYALYKFLIEPPLMGYFRAGLQDDDIEGKIALDRLSHQFKLWAARALTVSMLSALFAVFFIIVLGKKYGVVGTILGYAYALGTMAFCYSTVFYAHQIAAALLFTSFLMIDSKFGKNSFVSDFLPGLLIGISFIFEYPTLLIGGIIGIYHICLLFKESANDGHLNRKRYLTRFAIFAAGAFLPVIGIPFYNNACFGNPFKLGYGMLVEGTKFKEEMDKGIFGINLPSFSAMWGITFSPKKGIFIMSPFLVFAFPAVIIEISRWHRDGFKKINWGYLAAMLVVTVYFLFNSGYHFWDGGASVGPRHFIPALPFMVYLCTVLGRKWIVPLSLAATVSIVFASVATVTDPQSLKVYPLWEESWPMFLSSKISLTPFHLLGYYGFFPQIMYFLVPALLFLTYFFLDKYIVSGAQCGLWPQANMEI